MDIFIKTGTEYVVQWINKDKRVIRTKRYKYKCDIEGWVSSYYKSAYGWTIGSINEIDIGYWSPFPAMYGGMSW